MEEACKREPCTAGLVVPCFNEAAVVEETAKRVVRLLQDMLDRNKIAATSFVLFIDDGSSDRTWEIIERLHQGNTFVKGLKLSRNFGHQNALLAGLMAAKERADCVISLDADLQDDIQIIEKFVDEYINGYEIVYGVREERNSDSFTKRVTALGFYRFMQFLGVDIIYNHADYRLASTRALKTLALFGETNLFLRGIFPMMGFKSTCVHYSRNERLAGESKYPFRKMLSFAFEGITSFSTVPLRLVTFTGFLVCLCSGLLSIWSLLSKLLGNVTVPGWTSMVLSIYFLGGVQIMCLGVIGEYIGKIYKEVKFRPRFIIDREVWDNEG